MLDASQDASGDMGRLYRWAKGQIVHLIPAIIFFFIAFNLINLTEALMLRKEHLAYANFSTILLGAAIVAKALVVADFLPFIDLFPTKPLIYNIVWKTLVYGLVTLFVRFVMDAFPYLIHSDNLQADYILFITEKDWTRFWAVQLWFFALFFVYVFFREVSQAIGPGKIKKLLFKK